MPNRNQAPLFSPFFSGKTEKIGPPEARPLPSPMRGRWHGEAVTDEVEVLAST